MTYENLRQRLLKAGNFHPDEIAGVDSIVKAIGLKDNPPQLMVGLAYELAKFIEDRRGPRVAWGTSRGVN